VTEYNQGESLKKLMKKNGSRSEEGLEEDNISMD